MNKTLLVTRTKPTRIINFATVFPLSKPETQLMLARPVTNSVQLTGPKRLAPPVTRLQSRSDSPLKPAKLTLLERETLSVPRAAGAISRAAGVAELEPVGVENLQLPFGTPRFVNVATLKRMLRARRSDVLLKRVGDRWEIAENSMKVDLLDDSVEFRLGTIQIFS